jgi:hypothetical protein
MKNYEQKAHARFWAVVIKTETCWLYVGNLHEKGYGKFYYHGHQEFAHRVSWEWEYGPIPEGLLVCHDCDVPNCVRPDHLWLGTNQENVIDCVRKGRWDKRGLRNSQAQLNEEIVREIRLLAAQGVRQCEIGRQIGIPRGHVHAVVKRKLWAHVA